MTKIIKAIAYLVLFTSCQSIASTPGCDKCIESAVESSSKALESSLNQIKDAQSKINSSLEDVINTVGQSDTNLTAAINIQTSELQTALGGLLAVVNGSFEKLIKAQSEIENVRVSETVKAIQEAALITDLHERNLSLDPNRSQPLSLFEAIAVSPDIQSAQVEVSKYKTSYQGLFRTYSTDPVEFFTDANGVNATGNKRSEFKEEGITRAAKVLRNLSSDVFITDNIEQDLQSLMFFVDPTPTKISKPQGSSTVAMERYKDNIREQLIKEFKYSVLTDMYLSKAPLINTDDWIITDMKVTTTENGFTSFDEFIKSRTERKFNQEWLTELSNKTKYHALREQVVQGAIGNMLLAEIVKMEEKEVLLEALSKG